MFRGYASGCGVRRPSEYFHCVCCNPTDVSIKTHAADFMLWVSVGWGMKRKYFLTPVAHVDKKFMRSSSEFAFFYSRSASPLRQVRHQGMSESLDTTELPPNLSDHVFTYSVMLRPWCLWMTDDGDRFGHRPFLRENDRICSIIRNAGRFEDRQV